MKVIERHEMKCDEYWERSGKKISEQEDKACGIVMVILRLK